MWVRFDFRFGCDITVVFSVLTFGCKCFSTNATVLRTFQFQLVLENLLLGGLLQVQADHLEDLKFGEDFVVKKGNVVSVFCQKLLHEYTVN